jgi:hypothetical protein
MGCVQVMPMHIQRLREVPDTRPRVLRRYPATDTLLRGPSPQRPDQYPIRRVRRVRRFADEQMPLLARPPTFLDLDSTEDRT